jgi:zinc protease
VPPTSIRPYDFSRAGAALAAVAAAMTMVHSFCLDNGLRVVLAPRPSAPGVAIQAWIGAGSADDPPNLSGLAHAVEHMIFKGTARRGVGDIAATIEGAGGEINAFTSLDHTVFHLVVGPEDLELGLDVLGDALTDPAFDEAELERERQVIGEELALGAADPGRVVGQALFAAAFRRHPYRRSVLGTERSIGRITRPDLLRFTGRHYRGGGMTLAVAGAFEPAEASARIASHLGRLPPGGGPQTRTSEPVASDLRMRIAERDVSEAQLAIGFLAPPLAHPDHVALDLLAVALGQGESSRLHHRLRGEREVAFAAGAQVYNLRDPGLFAVSAVSSPRDAGAAMGALFETTLALAHQPISADELEKAIHAVEADAVYGCETAEGLARTIGHAAAVAGDPCFDEHKRRRARTHDPERLRHVAARWLRPERAVAVTVGPEAASTSLGGRAGLHRLLEDAVGSAAATRDRAQLAGPSPTAARKRAPARAAPTRRRPSGQRGSATVARRLPGGVKLIIHPDRSVPLVAARALWRGGLRLESDQNAGVNALLAAALPRGCGDRDGAAISRELDQMAATMSGFSGRNSFGARAEWLAADWPAGLELLLDCLLQPRLTELDIERERRELLEDIGARAASPSHLAFRLFVERLYHKHPYRLDPLGSPRSLQRITAGEVRDFYRRHYPPGALTISVVGDVDPEAVTRQLRRRLAGLEPAPPAAVEVARESFAGRPAASREVYGQVPRAQAHLVVGFPGATIDDPDRLALEALAAVLGGQGGRLFVELRERRGLAYRVGAHSQEGADPGYFAVVVTCHPDRAAAVLAEIRSIVGALKSRPLAAAELARAVRYLAGAHRGALERRGALAASLAFYEAHGLGWNAAFETPARLAALTPDDLLRAARRFLDWDVAVTATVAPPAASPEAARRARGSERRAPRRPRRR